MPALNNRITNPIGDAKYFGSPPKLPWGNDSEDIKTVQGLLNVQIIKSGGSDRLLLLTSSINSETVRAIVEFQGRNLSGAPSGLIKPSDATFSKLLDFSGPSNMSSSRGLRDWLEQQEALKLQVYDDEAGHPTIGYGHLLPLGDETQVITKENADWLFTQDVRKAEDRVKRNVGVPLTRNQFDALTSLAYNIKHFAELDLLKKLNGSSSPREFTGDYLGAAERFDHYI
ncbi:MAG: lysozyme, partial [Candidatus Binataceae bacterium]